jgi:hypothetical protein
MRPRNRRLSPVQHGLFGKEKIAAERAACETDQRWLTLNLPLALQASKLKFSTFLNAKEGFVRKEQFYEIVCVSFKP